MERLSVLSRNGTHSIPSYGDIDIRNTFTARGIFGLTPWNDASYKYSMLQLDLGYNPISNLEVVSMINVNSISRGWIYYNLADHSKKYNPKIYLGAQTSVAYAWTREDGTPTSYTTWPESYQFLSFVAI